MTIPAFLCIISRESKQYFRKVFGKQLILIIFLIFGFLYNSKGQSIRLFNSNKQVIAGATVTFSSLGGLQIASRRTDRNGFAAFSTSVIPVIRKILVSGFEIRIDTLEQVDTSFREIILQPIRKNLDEITVTGTIIPSSQSNSVYPVKTISREEIDKRAANTIYDLLSTELNINVSNDAILGSSLNIQGNGGENIKFLIDGVPLIGRQNGNIDLSELNLSNIERVEIVKGPMSVLYGTDALAGVVNLISKKITEQKYAAGINSYYESNGQYNFDGNIAYRLNNSSLRLNAGRNYFDGWNQNDQGRYQLWKPKEQYFGNMQFTHAFKFFNLTADADLSKDKITDKGITVITPYSAKAFDHYYTTQRFDSRIILDKYFNASSTIQITGAYSFYKHTRTGYIKNMVDLSEQLTSDALDNDTTQFNSVFARANYTKANLINHVSLLGGLEYNYESGQGARIDNSKHDIADYAIFSSIEYKPFVFLSVTPAIRAIYNTSYNAPLIPSVSFLYKPYKYTEIRISCSNGFRAPSLKEQYLDFEDSNHNVHGNPALKAETSKHFLASVVFKKIYDKTIVCVEPSLFYNSISNRISLIQADIASTFYQYTNIDKFKSEGSELALKISRTAFHFTTGISYTGISQTYDGSAEQSSYAWYPEYNSSIDYTFNKLGTTLFLQWKALGEKPVNKLNSDNSLSEYKDGSYSLLDFNIRKALLKNHLSITVGAKNILNVKEVTSYDASSVHSDGNNESLIATGTDFFAKLNLQF